MLTPKDLLASTDRSFDAWFSSSIASNTSVILSFTFFIPLHYFSREAFSEDFCHMWTVFAWTMDAACYCQTPFSFIDTESV
jgi:uncharacterized membrane protein (GlpM family)